MMSTSHQLHLLLIVLSCCIQCYHAFLIPQQHQHRPESTFRIHNAAQAAEVQKAAMPPGSLTGRLVVLTREAGKNDKLKARLEKNQVDVFELPCITHCHAEGYDKLSTVLETEHFDYVIITSPEAAHTFLEVVKSCPTYKPTNIVSIGEATGTLLRQEGAEIIFTPSNALAKVLSQELPPTNGSRPTRVLYPASKRAASTLENGLGGRGFEVVRLNTYDTVPAEWSEEEQAKAGACEVVTFASPSALKVWISRLGMNYKVACIGETTATAAKEAGWDGKELYWPKEAPGLEGWTEAVIDALR